MTRLLRNNAEVSHRPLLFHNKSLFKSRQNTSSDSHRVNPHPHPPRPTADMSSPPSCLWVKLWTHVNAHISTKEEYPCSLTPVELLSFNRYCIILCAFSWPFTRSRYLGKPLQGSVMGYCQSYPRPYSLFKRIHVHSHLHQGSTN